MNAKRTLRLRRDVLAELASDELESVVAANARTIIFSNCVTCPYISCVIECSPPPQTLAC